MAIPIINTWKKYYQDPHEGLGSSYERIVLNNKLFDLINEFGIQSVIETPSFGFTGLSGINSLGLAKLGCQVHLEDHCKERLDLIQRTWQTTEKKATFSFNKDYTSLSYSDNSYDLLWNFSALWFVKDLPLFLANATRIAKKAIVLCVPNQSGLGFRIQKAESTKSFSESLIMENINPRRISRIMKSLRWSLREMSYIDCPPWPDIGMNKEEFVQNHLVAFKFMHGAVKSFLPSTPSSRKRITILDYYSGIDPGFAERMMLYYPFEKYLPDWLKQFWAHHLFMLFIPDEKE